MKRLLCICLALLLAASLAGCVKTPSEPEPTQAPADTQSLNTEPPVTDQAPATEPPATEPPATEPPATEDPEAFRFPRENFPRLDGSTACLPMAEAVCSVLLGEDRDAVQDLIRFNRTTQSFRNLMDGTCDLLPNAAVFAEMEERGFACDMEQLGRDALIFVVNENNPVEGLTTDQIRAIYAGEITNWKEVGGEDAEIVPFQRNEGAGSQALMKKLVMGDTPLMEAPAEYYPGEMGALMTAVKSYDNSANAIGYSVYYYAHDMEMAQGLKLLKVDGVEPNRDTIRSGAYPHLNAIYCVIAHSAPADSPTRILYDWLMTEDGQRLLEAEGYVTNLDPK